MKAKKQTKTEENAGESSEKQPKTKQKKPYPLLPYLIGLFVMVVALVVLSYLMQLRNKQELKVPSSAAYTVQTLDESAFQM